MRTAPKYISFKCQRIVPPDSDEADELLALADALEVKLIKLVERLIESEHYIMATSILDIMITMTEELRHLIGEETATKGGDA